MITQPEHHKASLALAKTILSHIRTKPDMPEHKKRRLINATRELLSVADKRL